MTSAVLTWIGSPLTGVSALIAALSYTKSRREKVLEQASGVHAWINGAMTPVIYRNFDAVTGITHRVAAAELTIDLHLVQIEPAEHVRVHVLNASDHPVYDCHVEIVWDGIFTAKSDRHEDPVIAAPDGSIGFSLRYQDEIRRVNLWTQDWQPWEGESKQWATVLSAVGVDRIPSPLPAKKESYEFSLEQSLIFAADLSVLHTEETAERLVALIATIGSITFRDKTGKQWVRQPGGSPRVVRQKNRDKRP